MDARDPGMPRLQAIRTAVMLAAAITLVGAAISVGCANARGTDRPILQERPGSVYPAPATAASAPQQG